MYQASAVCIFELKLLRVRCSSFGACSLQNHSLIFSLSVLILLLSVVVDRRAAGRLSTKYWPLNSLYVSFGGKLLTLDGTTLVYVIAWSLGVLAWVALDGSNKCSAQISHPPSAVSWCNHPVAAVGGRPPHDAVSLSVNAIAAFLWASNCGHRWVAGGKWLA